MVIIWGIVPLPADVAPTDFTAPIGGASALTRAVRAMSSAAPVLVVVAEPSLTVTRECLAANDLGDCTVLAAAGAASFRDCVRTALDHLRGEPVGVTHVVVHDVRYPLATAELSTRVSTGLRDHDVVLPVLPMVDSVKVVDAQGVVGGNVDRAELCTVQYPRGYSVAALARWLDGEDLMPEAATVDGDPNAFAVDLVQDRALVEAILTAG
ncbi:2-C-methyl-D-erythritol 4-phosphate cytidylyltransferase [Mycobacterium sp. MAA66]